MASEFAKPKVYTITTCGDLPRDHRIRDLVVYPEIAAPRRTPPRQVLPEARQPSAESAVDICRALDVSALSPVPLALIASDAAHWETDRWGREDGDALERVDTALAVATLSSSGWLGEPDWWCRVRGRRRSRGASWGVRTSEQSPRARRDRRSWPPCCGPMCRRNRQNMTARDRL